MRRPPALPHPHNPPPILTIRPPIRPVLSCSSFMRSVWHMFVAAPPPLLAECAVAAEPRRGPVCPIHRLAAGVRVRGAPSKPWLTCWHQPPPAPRRPALAGPEAGRPRPQPRQDDPPQGPPTPGRRQAARPARGVGPGRRGRPARQAPGGVGRHPAARARARAGRGAAEPLVRARLPPRVPAHLSRRRRRRRRPAFLRVQGRARRVPRARLREGPWARVRARPGPGLRAFQGDRASGRAHDAGGSARGPRCSLPWVRLGRQLRRLRVRQGPAGLEFGLFFSRYAAPAGVSLRSLRTRHLNRRKTVGSTSAGARCPASHSAPWRTFGGARGAGRSAGGRGSAGTSAARRLCGIQAHAQEDGEAALPAPKPRPQPSHDALGPPHNATHPPAFQGWLSQLRSRRALGVRRGPDGRARLGPGRAGARQSRARGGL